MGGSSGAGCDKAMGTMFAPLPNAKEKRKKKVSYPMIHF
jgi:hypothetical protein